MNPTTDGRSALVFVAFMTLSSGISAAAEAPPPPLAPSGEIELWVRGPGKSADETPRGRSLTVDLDKLPMVDTARFDAQYARSRPYRGIALGALIERFSPETSLDLAILHFANGMAVPLPFRDAATMRRLEPFVARGMGARSKDPIQIGVFPGIPKPNARADARPIAFAGNKIVVAGLWHPALGDKEKPVFSPWSHTDTLTSIEFVESKPYYGQFDVDGDAQVQRGLGLFEKSCQFCHGARKTGARFGWDFVEPMPMYTYRKSMNLFYHVAYKPIDAAEKGLMMPAMRFMTQDDAAALWQWLRAVATKPMPAYTTAATTAHPAPAPGNGIAPPMRPAPAPAGTPRP
jgi:mono/diheme cytochrome c family protein